MMRTTRDFARQWLLGLTSVALLSILVGCGATSGVASSPTSTSTSVPSLDTPEGAALAMLADPSAQAGIAHTNNGDWRAVLDTPMLVHAYGAHTSVEYDNSDHWLASVKNSAGVRVGLEDFVYQRAQNTLRFATYAVLTAQDSRSQQAFPYITADTALAQLQAARGLGPKAGTQPELIFFPIDPAWRDPTSPVHNWKGGGDSPEDAMWRITATDGNDYFVGTDLKVYTASQLPIDPNQQ